MLREHVPLIAVTAVVALLFYLVFRDVRAVRADLEAVQQLMVAPPPPVELHDDAAKLQLQQMAELQHLQAHQQAQAAAQAQAQAAAQAQGQATQPADAPAAAATTKPAAKRA